jgi:very-short-patch-repair endonuclease
MTKLDLAKQFRRKMTRAESIVWQQLRRNQIGGIHFRRQQVLLGFIVDFYCHKVRLIIEIDGKIHDSQKEYDLKREAILKANGYKIIRFRNDEVETNLEEVMNKIEESLKE